MQRTVKKTCKFENIGGKTIDVVQVLTYAKAFSLAFKGNKACFAYMKRRPMDKKRNNKILIGYIDDKEYVVGEDELLKRKERK